MDPYKETFDTWDKVAKLYESKFMELELYDDTYDDFCEELGLESATILEIGCGPGNVTKYLLNKNPNYRITATDVSPNMVALAKANNPKADCRVVDCREIDKLVGQFNGIVCGFYLPYLSEADTSKLIKDCSNLLEDKGVLYISFVEGDYSHSGFQTGSSGDRVYFHFYTLDGLTKMLDETNFEIITSYSKIYKSSLRQKELHTIIIARK